MTWILPRQLHTLACALDTAALSLDCTEQSEVCARSLFVRSKPSPLRTWSAKWKRDSWTRHLSGRILRPSLGQRFVTEWTSLLAVTHASHSAQPDNEKVSKTRGIFGRLLQMVFDFSDQGAASLKTSKDISAWGCPTSSKTWQEWVTERRGAYSARLNAERLTKGSECSSWPSPVASEVRQGFQDRSRGMKGSQESLTTVVVKSWPTPNTADSLQGGTTQGNRKSPNLSIAAHGPPVPASSSTDGSRQGLWQTATVSTGAHKQKDGSMIDKLDQQVKSWATPATHDGTTGTKANSPFKSLVGDVEKITPITHGKLNPRWVETLMGLPVGWTMPSCVSPVTIEQTSCDYSAMESFRRQQNEPFEY